LLQATGGDVDAAIRRRTEQVQRHTDPFDDVAVKQLMQYKEQMEQLTQVTKEATAAAEDARRVRERERNDDLDVRRLQAIGRDEEADALRLQIAQDKERRQAERDLSQGEITRDTFDKLIEVLRLEQQAQTGATQTTSGPIQSLAAAQVQDIDRVVGELTTIRVRSGQVVSLLTQLVRGGGILGAVNTGIQSQTNTQGLVNGILVVS
jgi:DNA anti-recombination protein RmuC